MRWSLVLLALGCATPCPPQVMPDPPPARPCSPPPAVTRLDRATHFIAMGACLAGAHVAYRKAGHGELPAPESVELCNAGLEALEGEITASLDPVVDGCRMGVAVLINKYKPGHQIAQASLTQCVELVEVFGRRRGP